MRVRRPSHATVVAYVALFIALGGASYAAVRLPANSVGTRQIRNRAVTLKKISRSARRALKGRRGARGPQGATGAPGARGSNATINGVAAGGDLAGTFPRPTIAPGAVTAAKVAAANNDGTVSTPSLRTLGSGPQQALAGNGKAADSDLLDGIDSSGFIQGSGALHRVMADSISPGTTFSLDTGPSTLVYSCPASLGDPGSLSVGNDEGGLAPTWIAHDNATPTFSRVGASPVSTSIAAGVDHLTIDMIVQLGPTRGVLVDVFSVHDLAFNTCAVSFHYVAN